MDRVPCGDLQTDLFGPNGPHRPRGGATAPNQENCRGRASRDRDEPDATLKQASCVVGPVARPSAVPRQIGKAASQHRKAGKAVDEGGKPEVD